MAHGRNGAALWSAASASPLWLGCRANRRIGRPVRPEIQSGVIVAALQGAALRPRGRRICSFFCLFVCSSVLAAALLHRPPIGLLPGWVQHETLGASKPICGAAAACQDARAGRRAGGGLRWRLSFK